MTCKTTGLWNNPLHTQAGCFTSHRLAWLHCISPIPYSLTAMFAYSVFAYSVFAFSVLAYSVFAYSVFAYFVFAYPVLAYSVLAYSLTFPCSPIPCSPIPCSPIPYSPIPCLPIPCSLIPYSRIPCSPIPCLLILCSPFAANQTSNNWHLIFLLPICRELWKFITSEYVVRCTLVHLVSDADVWRIASFFVLISYLRPSCWLKILNTFMTSLVMQVLSQKALYYILR